ncbi:MAG TPA: hypothetical protein VN951_10605 [Pyrinomonadaceae bacterium]|nr:hypothetical protein [Pyrinomonadaceae bacterium]
MKNFNRRIRALSLFVLCLALAGGGAAFAEKKLASKGQPAIKVMLAGDTERKGERVALDKAGMVKPGEIINWTIDSANDGNGAARDYKVVGQIPAGTSFVAGSGTAQGASITYSIDGGKTFSARPTVEEKQIDGSIKRVAAPVSSYTQLRYEWSTPLEAGQKLSASYQVLVK